MRDGQTILYKSSPTDHQQPKTSTIAHLPDIAEDWT
ncbi:hypothetical protein BIW11_02827 [Tropilaelaps mercedesae]|uniref:Uncharacterized protein n=1 Tax=Tropilaelaps mercedesae TaxID=418985 RepID=A0A1V9XWY2_9ACAR|nr:hypothetical protein BIW11_02827 [Tropilaelaps mercedesae]